jgi:stage II sporulation protein D
MRLALFLFATSLLTAATLRVQINGRVQTMELEQYTSAVLAGESSVFQSEEALKAMAVAARTYAVRFRQRHGAEGFDLCDTTHCQRIDPRNVTARLTAAASGTQGELLWYNGKPTAAYYTRDCGGRSEDARSLWPDAAAPYLSSRADPYCIRVSNSRWRWEGDTREISAALQESGLRSPRKLERVLIVDRTASNRAHTLVLSGGGESIRMSASSFRFALGRVLGWNTLRSDSYESSAQTGRLRFDGHGSGHGAGLCQVGAEQMGREKHTYLEILNFYYPGTNMGLTAQGIRWSKMTGEHLSIFSTQPSQDAAVLALADRQLRAASLRTHRPIPRNIELRVYPDLDTFRNATGEPGWVAARASGTRIDLQPIAGLRSKGALESTLTHEWMHVLLESGAAPGLPVWFREGLAAYFTRASSSTAPAHTLDYDLQQTSDATRARAAYSSARRQVLALIERYSEAVVLSWLSSGLPREVANAKAKPAPINNR